MDASINQSIVSHKKYCQGAKHEKPAQALFLQPKVRLQPQKKKRHRLMDILICWKYVGVEFARYNKYYKYPVHQISYSKDSE